MFRKTPAYLTAGLILFGALVAIPTATAQGPTPDFDFKLNDIPNTMDALVQQTFEIEYTYTVKLQPQNLGSLQGSAIVTFVPKNCNPAITLTGDMTKVIPVNAQGTEPSVTDSTNIQIIVSRDAKAQESLQCAIEGTVTAIHEQGVPAPQPKTVPFSVQANYYGLLEATTDLKLKQGGPQKQIPFDITLTNFGNGQTKVTFETVEKPSGKWQGLVPDQALLDEKDGNRASTTATYTVVTPFKNGWNNEEGGFTIKIGSEYAFDPNEKGSDVIINLVARVRGVYVPTLEPLIMLGAVIGSAMIARLMRRE